MDIDYYNVLGLKRTSSNFEILNAFRKIIHKYGMEKLDKDQTICRLIAFEAYDVLCDPFWRAMHDQFGVQAIKLGVFVNKEKDMRRYMYHGDIFLTYKSIYGSTNPYAHIISMLINRKATINVGIKQDVEKIPIYLTLNEIFYGTLKKINIPKSDGTQCITYLKIPKGLPINSEIIHNLTDGKTVVFITNDLPHKHFLRSGQDLISTYTVTIEEIMFGLQFVVYTLDNKQLRVNITQVITPLYQKIIRGEGMPSYRENCDKRGDIILQFKIQIPRDLSVIKKMICKTTSKTEDFRSLRK
ncbi:dnaJ homolog subfamily B member 13-like [Melanaphis sacchari]|uniref:dnaJ homolog subfamily B member 13-like n=1 Tax=Melanaphis sacchari TaxID=742174 RepID=UPI000DC1491C|nr:dnaJ homolog subfamily B member 13-like [Melanaphis sacchari]